VKAGKFMNFQELFITNLEYLQISC